MRPPGPLGPPRRRPPMRQPPPPPSGRPMGPPRNRAMPPPNFRPPPPRTWRRPPPPQPNPFRAPNWPPPAPVRNCTWSPVCGSDGHNYPSACQMPRMVTKACDGHCPCFTAPRPPPCGCGPAYAPVCGTDEHTYDNYCKLRCSNQIEKCIGPCPCPTPAPTTLAPTTPPPCTCENQPYSPVCGKDSRVYNNDCERKCANVELNCAGMCPCERENGQVEVETNQRPAPRTTPPPLPPTVDPFFSLFQPFLPFQPIQPVADSNSCSHCWLDSDAVCGGDGRTYFNYCFARCNDAESQVLLGVSMWTLTVRKLTLMVHLAAGLNQETRIMMFLIMCVRMSLWSDRSIFASQGF
ncbi:serine protease inhibitor dipetalogastin-like [Pecten maximus]|uniref:serine protease inhibitor dipetalogastin-like n=1 Tax=Pecten maximus TaxID=6579 RepID=UPI001458DF5A|nr:serine protease inhibitor dipetalogastin-like [Pecten maximus]